MYEVTTLLAKHARRSLTRTSAINHFMGAVLKGVGVPFFPSGCGGVSASEARGLDGVGS